MLILHPTAIRLYKQNSEKSMIFHDEPPSIDGCPQRCPWAHPSSTWMINECLPQALPNCTSVALPSTKATRVSRQVSVAGFHQHCPLTRETDEEPSSYLSSIRGLANPRGKTQLVVEENPWHFRKYVFTVPMVACLPLDTYVRYGYMFWCKFLWNYTFTIRILVTHCL